MFGKDTSWWKRVDLASQVSLYEVSAKVMTPVVIGEENQLHWIRLHVDGKVAEVGNRVDGGQEEDDDAGDLVDVDVVLQWKDSRKVDSGQRSDCFPQDKDQDESRIEYQRLAAGS